MLAILTVTDSKQVSKIVRNNIRDIERAAISIIIADVTNRF
jgi:hypothetical protein